MFKNKKILFAALIILAVAVPSVYFLRNLRRDAQRKSAQKELTSLVEQDAVSIERLQGLKFDKKEDFEILKQDAELAKKNSQRMLELSKQLQ